MLARYAKTHCSFRRKRIFTNSPHSVRNSAASNHSPPSAPDSYLKSAMRHGPTAAIRRAWIVKRFFSAKRRHHCANKVQQLALLSMKLPKRFVQLKHNWHWKRIKFLPLYARLQMREKELLVKRVTSMDFVRASMQPTLKSPVLQQLAQRLKLAFMDLELNSHHSKLRLPALIALNQSSMQITKKHLPN